MKLKGFTLLELLLTITLFVCLSFIGTASYIHLVQKNEQQILLDELRTAIQYAKIQALLLGKSVTLTALDPSKDWSMGMKLSTFNTITNQKELIYEWQWHHPRWCMSWKGMNSNNRIMFSNNLVHAMSNGHFTLINQITHEKISIIVNRLGRLKVTS